MCGEVPGVFRAYLSYHQRQAVTEKMKGRRGVEQREWFKDSQESSYGGCVVKSGSSYWTDHPDFC